MGQLCNLTLVFLFRFSSLVETSSLTVAEPPFGEFYVLLSNQMARISIHCP